MLDEPALQRGEPVVLSSLTGQLPARTRLTPCTDEVLAHPGALVGGFIPRGAGRSYGDASYLGGGHTLDARGLEGVLELDERRGEIACLAGTPMRELARRALDKGWMLPVGGGTGWVTAGGAVATDIHGKNDPSAGSMGSCVLELELVTASGDRARCGPALEPELFAATVGGLGLTGLIRAVRLKLEPAGSGALRWRASAVGSMGELLERMAGSEAPYQAGWLDLTGPSMRGIHHQAVPEDTPPPPLGWSLPLELPTLRLLSQRAIRVLNAALFRMQRGMDRVVDVRDFVWSVDQIPNWHSLFGRRGFHELQFSVPHDAALEALWAVEREGRAEGVLPWFAMVKRFGDRPRVGLLSFPSPGVTFTADYPMGPRTEPFLRRFSDRVVGLGGRFCLAKDLVLAPEQVAAMYPNIDAWREVVRRWDPQHRVRSGLSDRLRLKPW
jgi:decaprenylphospho-beta-D-ribofuranose 2-oxidase